MAISTTLCRIKWEWPLILLTACLLLLTALQANGSMLTRNFVLVNQSRSYSIFFLRTFSEIAGLLLAATLAVTLDHAKWALVVAGNGSRNTKRPAAFVEFLALDEGTNLIGLLRLLLSPSVASKKARLWSLARLFVMAVVPITGILIMSKVEVQPVFTSVQREAPFAGYGGQPMNASTAIEYLGFTDMIFGSKFSSFVQGSTRSIDLTPEPVRSKLCGLNAVGLSEQVNCHREYFIPGESMYIMPEILVDPRYPEAGVFLANNHRGHHVRFETGNPDIVFDNKTSCRIYSGRFWGYPVGASQLCIVNTAPNEIHARFVKCPVEQGTNGTCMEDIAWQQRPGWVIRMTTSFRHASVAYSRINGTILWHSFNTSIPSTPSNISAAGLLKVYDTLLFDTTTLGHQEGTPLAPMSGSSFATMLWLLVPDFSAENVKNPEVASTWFSTMQSLLAMPLYYCQNGMMRRLIPFNHFKFTLDPTVDNALSPLPDRTTQVSFAYQRFETVADHGTLVAYVVVSGTALLFCIVVQLFIGIVVARRQGPGVAMDLTSFGAMDLLTHCVVDEKRPDSVVFQGQPDLASRLRGSGGSLLRGMSKLGVRWTGSGTALETREPEAEELEAFNWTWNGTSNVVGVSGNPHDISARVSPSASTINLNGLSQTLTAPTTPLSGRMASFSSPQPAYYWGVAK